MRTIRNCGNKYTGAGLFEETCQHEIEERAESMLTQKIELFLYGNKNGDECETEVLTALLNVNVLNAIKGILSRGYSRDCTALSVANFDAIQNFKKAFEAELRKECLFIAEHE